MFAEDHVAQPVLGCAPTDRSWVRHTIAPPNLREVDLHREELTAIGKPDLTVNLLKTEHLFGYPFFYLDRVLISIMRGQSRRVYEVASFLRFY